MRLSSRSQVNTGEYAMLRNAQGRDVNLGKMHVDVAASMDTSDRLPIDDREVQT